MSKIPADFNLPQFVRDVLSPNRYRLDDRFVLRDGKRHPFAILCPGGAYWMVCSYIEGVPIARKLNKAGYSAFILHYRTKEKALYPAPQDDLAMAVKDIFLNEKRYSLDTSHYSIWGFSAGGHLAASFGTEHMGYKRYSLPKPATLVLSYPVISMKRNLTHQGTHDNLLGKDATLEREMYASVEEHITPSYPPTFIWCGDADDAVSPENTKRMSAALEKAGVPCRCMIFPGVGHGVGPGSKSVAEGWINQAIDFCRNYS